MKDRLVALWQNSIILIVVATTCSASLSAAFEESLAVASPNATVISVPDRAASLAFAQEPKSATKTDVDTGDQFDDVPQPLEPHQQRDAAGESRVNALAAFGRGRILEGREDYNGALAAYEKALEYDPHALPAYKALIGLAINLRRNELAARWITLAAEANPDQLAFVLQAVRILVDSNDFKRAIRILENAKSSPTLDQHSVGYLDVSRALAVLYLQTERVFDALDSLAVLIDAIEHPEAFQLTAVQRTALRRDLDFEKFGHAFLKAKRLQQAIASYRIAADSESSSRSKARSNLEFNVANAYLQADQAPQALEQLQKYFIARRKSKGRAAYELLAEILEKLGKSNELVSRLEALAQDDAKNSELQFYLADQYVNANRLDEAEALYKKTMASDEAEEDIQGYVGLAALYRKQGRVKELFEVLVKGYSQAGELGVMAAQIKLIAEDPDLFTAIEKSATDLLAANDEIEFAPVYVLANIVGEGKKAATAEKLYRKLLAAKPDRAEILFREMGSHYFDNRQYAEAARIYAEAAENDELTENRPENLLMAGRAYALGGKTSEALEAIREAQSLVPNNPLLRYQEAWVYVYSRQHDEAISRLEQIIADFPNPGGRIREIIRQAQYTLSTAHVMRGDNRKGEEILEEILKEEPEDEQLNNDLGYLYADQGKNLEQAEQMIRKAIAAKPENGAYIDSMGWVLFKQGKYAEALPWLEKAVKFQQGSGDETLWEHLGENYDRLGQTEKAIESWKKSLETAEKAPFRDEKLIERVKKQLEKNRK